MPQLLIIADDLTGALDSGVHFSTKGIKTVVKVSDRFEPTDADVVIIDTETRHVEPEVAYEIVFGIVKEAWRQGVRFFLKKTDSVLRGRVGAEVAALSDAVGETVHFVPAYPSQGRITKDGVQFVEGVPVHLSMFGKDPFSPVKGTTIAEILGMERLPVFLGAVNGQASGLPRGIRVYDAVSDEAMEGIVKRLEARDELHFLAGCAGIAKVLAEHLPFERKGCEWERDATDIFTLCGSLNPVSERQIEFAAEHGFERMHLPACAKFTKGFLLRAEGKAFFEDFVKQCREAHPLVVDVFDGEAFGDCEGTEGLDLRQAKELVAGELGALMAQWVALELNQIPVIIGGDTLMGFLEEIDYEELVPVSELAEGVVLSELILADRRMPLVSKSGGLGSLDALVAIREELIGTQTQVDETRLVP